MQTLIAWIDARHPMANRKMWGLTILERNIRELERLGCNRIYVATTTETDPLSHFCQPLPEGLSVVQETVAPDDPFANLRILLKETDLEALLIDGHALNDRRVLKAMLAANTEVAVIASFGENPGAAACLSRNSLELLDEQAATTLPELAEKAAASGTISLLDLAKIDPYIENLRREIPPYLMRIESEAQFQEAESVLELTVHKGVNDFVAKYIHPPLEFGVVRLTQYTKISPNQVTIFWLILAALAAPLFVNGYILAGLILAAVSGILDGVDGKLARLKIRFSKAGDRLDHIGNTLFDAIWYLALGWYFSGGDPQSAGAMFTYLLVASYLIHRIAPGLFRLLHHHEIYDYERIDAFVRLIGARMNNNIWLMLVGAVLGYARASFYIVCIWMAVTAIWYILRFLWVTFTARRMAKKLQFTNAS